VIPAFHQVYQTERTLLSEFQAHPQLAEMPQRTHVALLSDHRDEASKIEAFACALKMTT
jgi:hypothetical protein